jgi:hypothetical protein
MLAIAAASAQNPKPQERWIHTPSYIEPFLAKMTQPTVAASKSGMDNVIG